MAEIEQASLRSEQLSDKSSSPALPDDLSLDEHTAFRLLTREGTVSNAVISSKMGSFVSWESCVWTLGSKSLSFLGIAEKSLWRVLGAVQVTRVPSSWFNLFDLNSPLVI